MIYAAAAFLSLVHSVSAASSLSAAAHSETGSTCYDIKSAYQASSCCSSNLHQQTDYLISASPPPPMHIGSGHGNVCAGAKPTAAAFDNTACTLEDGITAAVAEQAGANVTLGYVGGMSTTATPITKPYWEEGLCPVNVHWHLGTEHLSVGQYDEHGKGPTTSDHHGSHRRMNARKLAGGEVRHGFHCHHYDEHHSKFTTEYDWKYCVDMKVGETYEVHWPHSKAGACGTPNQYQSPFYDGVFCRWGEVNPPNTQHYVGVQSQSFTIINDEDYYFPDLMRGMIVDGDYGKDIAKYTGSTTGTSRNNEICSAYTPITWQVDRKCHLISASSFDKMCMDMLAQRDDMSSDLHAHGSRELVANHLAADNLQRRSLAATTAK